MSGIAPERGGAMAPGGRSGREPGRGGRASRGDGGGPGRRPGGSRRARVRTSRVAGGVLALLGALVLPAAPAAAQELADFDYENLSLRGIGFEIGYLFPDRVDRTASYGVRFDLGYLGPSVRLVPTLSYWSSPFSVEEVTALEERVASLVSRETGAPPPVVNLGTLEWTDYTLGIDTHVVWAMPANLLSFAGLGLAVHILDGSGAAIEGTFIEDLLDTATAGINLHLGLEYPLTNRFRLQGQGRYELLEDLQYFQLRFGWQLLLGRLVPGEERGR